MPIEREWVTITDPDNDHLRYTFDVSFLLSDYTCIYGAGCQGVRSDGADEVVGCCEHGAYLTEDDERPMLEEAFHRLSPDTMEFWDDADEDGLFTKDDEGELKTRTVDDACIFLNRAGFEAGVGCALHHLAEREGEHHMTFKPVVCWQVPLHREIEEKTANDGETLEVHTIAAYERGTWGDGGADFHWWCTESPDAFVGDEPVYRSMEAELREMVGDAVYDELKAFLKKRKKQRHRVKFLPVVDSAREA